MTIREMIKEAQHEILNGDLTPLQAAYLDAKLSAIQGNCFAEIREASVAYSEVLIRLLDSGCPKSHASVRAAVTPEWLRLSEAKDTHEVLTDLIRSTRHIGRAATEEARLSR